MEITFLIAKIMGIYMMVSGFVLILKGKSLIMIMKDFYDHPALMYLTGTILIFLSSIYLIQFNLWDFTYRAVVTIFVWLIMLKGLSYIFIPKFLSEIPIKKYQKYFVLYGFVSIFVGVYLFLLR